MGGCNCSLYSVFPHEVWPARTSALLGACPAAKQHPEPVAFMPAAVHAAIVELRLYHVVWQRLHSNTLAQQSLSVPSTSLPTAANSATHRLVNARMLSFNILTALASYAL